MKARHYLMFALLACTAGTARSQCTASGSHYTANYSAPGWVYTDLGDGVAVPATTCDNTTNGNFYLSGSAAYFYTARNGRELRVSKTINTVSNTSWTMDFTLVISPPLL